MSWPVVLQMVLASALGAIVGFEREVEAQQAGLRTHMLVALGAALFTVAGAAVLDADPVRVAAQVVTGVGFLGGGAILREGLTVHGLTTAASLWVTAAVGVAIGLEQWVAATAATVLAVVVLRLLKIHSGTWPGRAASVHLRIDLLPGASAEPVAERLTVSLPEARTVRVRASDKSCTIELVARPKRDETLTAMVGRVRAIEGIAGVEAHVGHL